MQRRWQQQQQQAIRDPMQLVKLLGLDETFAEHAKAAARHFPLRVPMPFALRMEPGNPNDPLLRQILPLDAELTPNKDYSDDPVADLQSIVAPGVLHKYNGRALLTVSPVCGVHCRYCFRREFPYEENHAGGKQQAQTLDWLAENEDINEVIFSGGDPLMLSDDVLSGFVAELEEIPHIRRVRIHTRQPIVLPSRVDSALLDWLGDTHLQTVMVLHCNHANEIDDDVYAAMDDLRSSGTTLLNQSVLLKGVNDDIDVLCKLSEALFNGGALPYYLNMLDKVSGSAHFDVPKKTAIALATEMRTRLPGFLVPRLVKDEPGTAAKTVVY